MSVLATVNQLRETGLSVEAACKRAKVKTWQYYSAMRKADQAKVDKLVKANVEAKRKDPTDTVVGIMLVGERETVVASMRDFLNNR